jgi:hypothetical protein
LQTLGISNLGNLKPWELQTLGIANLGIANPGNLKPWEFETLGI